MPVVPTRLVLIRHGEARAATEGFVAGHESCRGLTERGRWQAEALRDRLLASGELETQAVFTSVLPRAIETAEILVPALGGLKAERDCDLCELHPGEADGLSWEQYRERYSFNMSAEPDRPMSPGGESLATFQSRVDRGIDRVLRDRAGQTVVVVSHGGVVSAASLSRMDHAMNASRSFRLRPENTSITEWTRVPEEAFWVLVRYNDSAHIEASRR